MFSNKGYMKVNRGDENEDTPTLNPIVEMSQSSSQINGNANTFSIKVLCKEKSYEISGLCNETTITELKRLISPLVDIPPHRQRLIMTGKLLKPEDKNLAFFKIGPNSSVHLFPIPEAVATQVPVATDALPAGNVVGSFYPPVHFPGVPNANNSNNNTGVPVGNPPIPLHPTTLSAIYSHASLEQSVREVRLWCFILLSLSAMDLFNNFSYFTATGKVGDGVLDTIIFFFDTFCSIGGIWVGTMGMKSIQTLQLPDVRRYVQWLGVLAFGCIIFRLLWVIDVVLQVQNAVKHAKENEDADNNNNTDPDSNNNNSAQLDDQAVVAFGVQASVIALICIGAWLSCFRRALRFHTTIAFQQTNQDGSTVAPPAVATQV